MPPSSTKRGRAPRRTAADAQPAAFDDAEDATTVATPSRSTRKRGRDNTSANNSSAHRAATRRKIKETTNTTATAAQDGNETDGTEAQEHSDADTEPALPSEVDVISKLRVSDKFVHASVDFANDLLAGVENVPGFGKIAGRDWTFIIKDVTINIGRPEQHEKVEPQDGDASATERDAAATAAAEALTHKSNINIDLGPDRQTSRLHATIAYDSPQEQWYIIVNGRNGLRLDSFLLKRGSKALLRSGSVIDIGGTQMAFVTTPTRDNQGPVFADAILRQIYSSEDDEAPGDRDHTGHARAPLPRPTQQQRHQPSSVPTPAAMPPAGHSDDPLPSSNRAPTQSQASFQTTAAANTSFATPGTPVRQQTNNPGSRPSPIVNGAMYGNIIMEPTESIDYAADSAKELKPPHSYAQLIGMAILSTGEQQMTLNNIYKWIMANYAFYRHNTGGWQNSIRHNLSLNKAFEKIARRTDEPGKGMKWIISPKERDTFLSQGMKGCRRPNSLADPSSPTHFGARKVNQASEEQATTFGSSSFPAANEAFTPDRGSTRRPISGLDDNEPGLSYNYPPSVKSTLNHLTAAATAAGSPPALYTKEEGRMGLLDTPFPMRSSQKLMPPSTLQQPSAFMEFSSPAPFWKFGSTPLRPLADMSPVKTPFSAFRPLGPDTDAQRGYAKSAAAREDTTMLQSSSPPPPMPATAGDASPSRTSSRPVTSHGRTASMPEPSPVKCNGRTESAPIDTPTIQSMETSNGKRESGSNASATPDQALDLENTSHGVNGHDAAPRTFTHHSHNHSHAHAHAPNINMPHFDNEDEGGIDLMKGFQPIGSFHKLGASRFSIGMTGPSPAPGAVSR